MIESKKSTGTAVLVNTEESSETIVDNRNDSLGTGRTINKTVRYERRKGKILCNVLRTHMMKYKRAN